jgi:hypothetical protein
MYMMLFNPFRGADADALPGCFVVPGHFLPVPQSLMVTWVVLRRLIRGGCGVSEPLLLVPLRDALHCMVLDYQQVWQDHA